MRAQRELPFRCSFSGSDIQISVREALMEPLRKCRTAKFFVPVPGTAPPKVRTKAAAVAAVLDTRTIPYALLTFMCTM